MAPGWIVNGSTWKYDPSAWRDTCIYLISMPDAKVQQASVQSQLRAQRLGPATIWPGVVIDDEQRAVRDAIGRKLLPPSYLHAAGSESATARRTTRGNTGNLIAHLSLWRHTLEDDTCTYTLVLEDDVALLPSFGAWTRWQARTAHAITLCRSRAPSTPDRAPQMARAPSLDILNLHNQRVFGRTGEKPWYCLEVDASMRRSSALRRHRPFAATTTD